MITPHRRMYNVLTPDEYRAFLRNSNPRGLVPDMMDDSEQAILYGAFDWISSTEGIGYWYGIAKRLGRVK